MNVSPKPPTLRILIVEDDPMMQLGLEQALENYPQFEIVGQAEDGYLGVEAALKLKPDLVVMDIGLPQLDSVAATKQIKAALPEIRVVVLTSHTTETEIIAALASGADAYCIKGASVERLLSAIAAGTFASLDELEEVLFQRCHVLLQQPDLIKAITNYHWWPTPAA